MSKYLDVVGGVVTQKQATETSAGAGDAGKLIRLDSAGKLDLSLMPNGLGADTIELTASENLAAGDLVNIWNDAGTAKVRKADATSAGKPADGYVLGAVTADDPATVYREGTISGLSSLTPGTRYYLATTAGGVTDTPPSGASQVVQAIGVAISATELAFERQAPITLAA